VGIERTYGVSAAGAPIVIMVIVIHEWPFPGRPGVARALVITGQQKIQPYLRPIHRQDPDIPRVL
jgi:hypothetical protein